MKTSKITPLLTTLALLTGTAAMPVMKNAAVTTQAASLIEGTYEQLSYLRVDAEFISITDCDEAATVVEIPAEIGGVKVTEIYGNTFQNCTELTSVTIPDTVTKINSGAFTNCTKLTEIVIPDSVTEFSASNLFNGCTSLTSVTFPEGLTTIKSGTFSGCTALTSYRIPDTVTLIEEEAFYSCTGLTEITIPDSVTEIMNYAFIRCDALTDVYFNGTEDEWNAITIGAGNEALLNASLHFRATDPPTVTFADLNSDNSIDATDAALLLSAAAAAGAGGDSGLTAEQIAAADLDGNGTFDASDASLILMYAAYAGAGGELDIMDYLSQR